MFNKAKKNEKDFSNLCQRVKILEKQVVCEHKPKDILWDMSNNTKICNSCGLLLKRYNPKTFTEEVEVESKKYIKEIEDNENMEYVNTFRGWSKKRQDKFVKEIVEMVKTIKKEMR